MSSPSNAIPEGNASVVSPLLVFVRPLKALEFIDDAAVRVTPRSSLSRVLSNHDSNDYTFHDFPHSSIALNNSPDAVLKYSSYVTNSSITVVFGTIENADYLKFKHNLDSCCGPAELVYSLILAYTYKFVGRLRGNFSVVQYDIEKDTILAATDLTLTYNLKQGRDGTGGLLVTDGWLGDEIETKIIPAASFIFGRYPDRDCHKYARTPHEVRESQDKAESSVELALAKIGCKDVSDNGSERRYHSRRDRRNQLGSHWSQPGRAANFIKMADAGTYTCGSPSSSVRLRVW
ncbi:hypothetical protein CYMTET_48631 [Cymbomonas tetramitiformis]|uniref:Uncharacterized protein n=1 Tax=Cymbomonas tetramitiformis TaxID=36881 RepID=A0AAE0BTQ2_9CHLO|nr:hypothetical protein CYMTET_48631 [Cymbomonas tetramitiformis]